jgi:hypothetical protein
LIKLVIYFSLLIAANTLAVISILKNSISKENTTYISYIAFGILFELIFLFTKPNDVNSVQLYFSLLFPYILSISALYRLSKNYKIYVSRYTFILLCSYFTFNINDLIACNFIATISLYLVLIVTGLKIGKIKWHHSIDFLIAINLYFMHVTSLISQKVFSWANSQLLKSFHLTVSLFLLLTLCLINVKLWRSAFN